ncbi:PREDICTED: crocetin glucosyltransferase, chloroplastic-like [Ipomoea nil]|uniref:crocetin glucosyltransferase, chloroplastic-like n=1 Tax=Ipomoea nil TaxID=35883 RepID=UPI0009012C1E|nr:PREDICTED: crocetin glucosyltransferase, chloroplastic-like [Ipomoea nil]
MVQPHILLVTFPAQGHINPSLQFAKRLVRLGIEVTFATSVYAHRLMSKANGGGVPDGLNFTAFSDGYDEGFKKNHHNVAHYMSEIRTRGSSSLKGIVSDNAAQGRPITAVVHTLLLPWVSEVARDVNLPSALLWIQPAAVLDIYYYYFHGYEDAFKNAATDPNCPVQLPGLPPLFSGDLPSFLLPSGSGGDYSFAMPTFKEEIEKLDLQTNPTVLVNTFDALEAEGLKSISSYNLLGVGPLIPSAFLDGKDPSDTAFGGDLFKKSKDDGYINDWLSSQPESSVVYISFGSLLNPSKTQKEEIAKGLLEIKRPFLWVIRDKPENEEEEEEEKLSCMEELEKQGLIVPWCSQIEVLKHPSLGCFITHCGWNSTLESICSGTPVVAFPHWTDQGTNAKLIQDVWKTGVRVTQGEDGVVGSEEIKRCIETVMDGGDKGEELRRNAKKWRDLAMEANREGGSSDTNLKSFAGNVRNH